MNRIENLFQRKKNDVTAVYFTAGYPRIDDTIPVLQALEKAGADLVEIGMPFSDPLADGPVIQESSKKALENGMSIAKLFEQLGSAPKTEIPVVLMGYLNPVLQFGVENFLKRCKTSGVDGVILPDLPVEVFETEYKKLFRAHGIACIFLVTPLTPPERIRYLASQSEGFLYLVSTASTTGGGKSFSAEQLAAIQNVSALDLQIPILTGFGIHDYETRVAASRFTNGVVVGSAFIRELAKQPVAELAAKNLVARLTQQYHDHSITA